MKTITEKNFNAGHPEINTLLRKLKNNPDIAGIIIFGSRCKGTYTNHSDVDLLLVLQQKRPVEIDVIHPTIEKPGIRFDIWLRTKSEINELKRDLLVNKNKENPFVLEAISTGKILKDTSSLLKRTKQLIVISLKNKHINVNFIRFRFTHAFESLQKMLPNGVLEFNLMLRAEIITAIYTYAEIHDIKYKSLKELLRYLKKEEKGLYKLIEKCEKGKNLENKLRYLKQIFDKVISPLGKLGQKGEFIATGDSMLSPKEQNKIGINFWENLIK